jgi:hypothetical protein
MNGSHICDLPRAEGAFHLCHICGTPSDASFFDEAGIRLAPENPGDEVVLASYQLHRNYCGVLLYFSQYTDAFAQSARNVRTPGYLWEIRINGQPRDPYLAFDFIRNPWGLSGFPLYLRLEEGCLLEFVLRDVGAVGAQRLSVVGGRLVGRYWYNNMFGGAPNRL